MKKFVTGFAMLLTAGGASAAQVFVDDLIVQPSLCVGFDCANDETFDSDTIRLRENNLRIRFDDTSSTGSFPATDWQLTANDTTNGGRNRFSIEDVSVNHEIFTVMGGAPSYSLYVGDAGNVGLGTDEPGQLLHLRGENTPTLRIEQSGTGGFQPATWDVSATAGELRIALNGTQRLQAGRERQPHCFRWHHHHGRH